MRFKIKNLRVIAIACVILASILASSPVKAVTQEEMDRARAVAAQWYLRWANNGSDYLDNLEPKSMAELEGKLKEKEKQNIKAFKNVPVPGDYASWDKEKVVEYWSNTFFKSEGLNDQGRGARARVKKKLSAMNFSDPSEVKAAEEKKPETEEEGPVLPSAAPEDASQAEAAAAEQMMADAQAIDSTLLESAEQAQEEPKKEKSSSLWLYIVALVVLVGVVVWLVIFASKTMQGSGKDSKQSESRDSNDEPVRRRDVSRRQQEPSEEIAREEYATAASSKDEKSLRDKFARTLTVKEEEIRSLRREINNLRDECMKLGEENGRLTSDLSIARRELDGLRGRLRSASSADIAEYPTRTQQAQAEERHEAPVASPDREKLKRMDVAREIYLGRVNSKGLFVRADRKPVEGKSVFVLSTTDNYTGTYRVLQASATIDMSLDNPEYYLAGGCVASDITNTAEADGIRTINSGTAIFEDGCWKVLRKAKIAYE